MYTDFIPLPPDGEERNKIIGLVESLNDFLPDQMTITDALQITTDNPRMAELLASIFHPETVAPAPEPKARKRRSKEVAKVAIKLAPDQYTTDPAEKAEGPETVEVVLAPDPDSGPSAALRPCDECHTMFLPRVKKQRFCTPVCSKTWHNRETSKKAAAPKPDQRKIFAAAYSNALAKSVLAD